MKKYISLIIFTTFLALTGCATEEPATKPVEQVAEVASPEPTKEPVEETPDYAKEAKKIEKDLAIFFDCEWETTNTTADSIVHVDVCASEEILIATGERSGVNVWLDNMGEVGTAYAVHGEEWAVLSPDEGTRNQAWDALGAEGETETIGE